MEYLVVKENQFKTFNLTTTISSGNMKDVECREKFCKTININSNKIVFANQVHGTSVHKVTDKDCGCFIEACDGLITNSKDIALCIFTADCMPVFMASKDYSVVAMVHAGWRGLVAGIIENATIRFEEDFGVKTKDIVAYVGPHIQKCCYQVGDDVKNAFGVSLNETNLSMAEQAKKQFKNLGIQEFYISSHCTCHEYETFYSYRRQKTNNRIMSLIKAI